ncbi:MAG: Restriction alleviation protein Lar [Bacillota bacterium]|nr:Restriction alleviation protein Lar [Bacillota bacterium]
MATDLKPCPFCGGKAEYEQFANPKTSYSVKCTVCRCGTYGWDCPSTGTHDGNKAMQAERWNRRKGELTN